MALRFKHFDTRLNQWIHTDGNKNNSNSVLTEKPLENTLLEALLRKTYPDIEFTIGHADEHAQVQDLKQHPEGQVLLLSSKSRLVYGPPECLETIDKIFPDRKDRGAYGSVLLGGCSEAFYEELNILIVDDSTGANGGIINDKLAYELTGDCYGQISPELYDRLAKPGNPDTPQEYKIIQHRFGWTPEDGNDPHFRFGKGTFRPKDLTKIGGEAGQKIDLILPLSSFKGTDKDNPSPSGPQKPQIKPGLHKQRVWVGNKSESQQGKTAISQLLASFPSGVKDFVEELESEAMRLQQVQNDPRKVAELYCERYEEQKNFSEQAKANVATVTENNQNGTTVSITDEEPNEDDEQNDKGGIAERDDLIMYKLIKADLMGHHQILETEKVKQELSRFMQKQWSNVALGKTITFDRAMIIPSKELKNGEICVPWMENGEEIINFRSPFLNSNGACVSVNRHIQDMEGPDGKKLKGVIIVNDEDFNRIFNRINSQVQNTVAILKEQNIDVSGFQEYLNQDVNKLEDSEKYTFIDNFNEQIKGLQNQGYNIELIPKESESARQGRDFDGDCIGVTRASQYPNLTAEIKYRNLPENAYEPTVKLKKVSFYNADGSQPEFEQIALQMSDGISVGIINNQVTSLTALESEIEIIKNSGTQHQKSDYVDAVAKHYEKLFSSENNERKPEPIDEQYRDGMLEIVRLASIPNRSEEIVDRAMEANRLLYRKMLEEASKQNQVAVDMFKSARLPDIKAIETIRSYLYRVPTYIKEKKSQAAYLSTGIKTNGVSPVELLVNQTNSYFKEAVLESRPMRQFQDLFQGIAFTNQERLKNDAKRKEYETIHNQATALDTRRRIEKGPYAITKMADGKELQITNLTKFNHPGIWQGKALNIEFQETDREKRTADKPHRFIAVAQIDGEMENGEPLFLPLGTVDVQSANNLNLKNGSKVQATVVELMPELTKSQTQVMFQRATEIAQQFRQSIPTDQLLANAAACWAQSTIRENTTQTPKESSNNSTVEPESTGTKKRSSSFFYATYGDELVGQLAKMQLDTLEITGLASEKNHFQGRSWNPEEKHDIQIGTTSRVDSSGNVQNKRSILVRDETGNYQEFGTTSEESANLPIGTTVSGSIAMLPSATANATFEVNGGNPITVKVGKIKNCDFANHTFENENLTVEVKPIKIADPNKVFIRIGDRTLGRLSKETAEELQKITTLNDKAVTLKLTSQVEDGQGAYAIGITPRGNQIRIEGISQYDFAGQSFKDVEDRKCHLHVSEFKQEIGLSVDGKRIGVVTLKKDQEALKQAGLMGNVKGIITDDNRPKVNCTINSNFTVANIKVEPKSVKEPEIWITEAQAFKGTTPSKITQIDEGITQAKPFLKALTKRPTIYFQSSEMKETGVVGMAVDNHQVEVYRRKLQEKNVEFTQLPPEQISQETKKGLAIFNVKGDSMAPGAYESLQKSGIILDSNPQISPVGSQYQQALSQIINRPTEIANDPQKIAPASPPKVVSQQNTNSAPTTAPIPQQNTNLAPTPTATPIPQQSTDSAPTTTPTPQQSTDSVPTTTPTPQQSTDSAPTTTPTPQKRVISTTTPVQKPNVPSTAGEDNKSLLTPAVTTEVILNPENKLSSVTSQTVAPVNKKIIPIPTKNNHSQQTAPPSDQAQATPTDITLLSPGDSAKRFIPLGYRKLVESIKSSLIEIEHARAAGNTEWENEAKSFLGEDEFNINDSVKFRTLTDIAKGIIDAEKVLPGNTTDKEPTEPVKQADTATPQNLPKAVEINNIIPSNPPILPVVQEEQTGQSIAEVNNASPANNSQSDILQANIDLTKLSERDRSAVENIKLSLLEIKIAYNNDDAQWVFDAESSLKEHEYNINDGTKFSILKDIAQIVIDTEKTSALDTRKTNNNINLKIEEKFTDLVNQLNAITAEWNKTPFAPLPDNPQPIAVSPVVTEAPIDSPIKLPSAHAANKTVPIEVMGQISPDKVQQILEHLETHIKPLLRQDMSQYAPGRQVAWVGTEWGLKDKGFLPGVEDKTLQNLMQQVYPGSTMMLISYSENEGNGINYHRDDSYAAIEARTINLGPSDWGFRATNEQMSWTKDQNDAAPYQQFNLEPGAVIRFNCKDEHAAINPSAGRWSINIWEVKNDLGRENSVREKFNQHLESLPTPTAIVNATPPITITTNDWQPGGSIKPHTLTYNVIHSKQEVNDATYNQKYLPVIKSAVEKGIEVKLANDTGVNGRIIGTLEELGYTVSSQTITQSTKDGERKRTAWSGVPKQELKIEVTPQIPNAQAPSTPTPTPTTPIPTTPTPFAQPSPTPTIQTEPIPTLASLPISTAPAVPVALQNVQPTPPLASPPLISEHTPTRQNPETPIISGKPIAMSYGLMMYGDRNELPVNSTIEAMRGHGRTHTTRQYEPYKAYGFKEGDIAIAKDGNTQVAFRVGKQYQILQHQIADPKFQASWAAIEKHSAKALPELFSKKTEIWGLHMEPLGDYVNGKIVPFPDIASIKQTTSLTSPPTPVKEGVNIGATSNNPLGAALSNATVSAKENGKITSEYPVSFGDNAAVPAGKYGPETYPVDKPAGVPYVSAEQAFQAEKHKTPSREQRVEIMTQILQAKLEQHPKLAEGIKAKGGVEWLENSTHYVTYAKDSYWEGKGKDSPFVRALIDAYSKVLESQITTDSAPTPVVATIAVPNAPDSSSPPAAAFTHSLEPPKQTSDSTLVSPPTADIQLSSVFTGSAASKYEETTLQNIRNWYVTCVAIGKPQAYLDRIQEVGKDFKAGGALSDAASIAMNKDQEQIRPINKLIQIGERLGETQRTINAIERNDFRPVQDFIAKGYNFSLKKDSKDFSIHTSEGTPVLVLSNGVIKANNITPEISQNFDKINQNLTKDIETLKKGLSSVDRIVM